MATSATEIPGFEGRLSVTTAEFARATGRHRESIRRMIREKRLPANRVGRDYVIPIEVLRRAVCVAAC